MAPTNESESEAKEAQIEQKVHVFLCGARDFHAMDWYRSAKKVVPDSDVVIVTDLIQGEGYERLIGDDDTVYRLIVLDRILLGRQTHSGDIWRNILKAVLFPFQVILLLRFARQCRGALYQAHSMYYLWLAWAAGVDFVGIPQGSDILEKPSKSRIYKAMSVAALRAAKAIAVDSRTMADGVYKLSGVSASIIQNGIDINSVEAAISSHRELDGPRSRITSFRGLTPLYNIRDIVQARNTSSKYSDHPVTLTYPFYEQDYATRARTCLRSFDSDLGRVDKLQMYSNFLSSLLAISIPSSDSSPRSVYEAIFCGAAVALTYHPFVDAMPDCMRSRVILVDLGNLAWFDDAVDAAAQIAERRFMPSTMALDMFDQDRSFAKVLKLVAC